MSIYLIILKKELIPFGEFSSHSFISGFKTKNPLTIIAAAGF